MDLNIYNKSDYLGINTSQKWMNFAIFFYLRFFFPDTILGICFGFPVIHIIPLFYSQTKRLWPQK
jgi:hypothetical protein